MFEMDYEDRDGHILLNLGGRIALVDTGAPRSLAAGPFDFLGATRTVPSSVMGVDLPGMREMAGFHFDVLLGTDLLCGQDLLIRGRERRLTFGSGLALEGQESPMRSVMGVPQFNLSLGGRSVSALLDTGAWLSYILSSGVTGIQPAGEYRDFNPMLGRYSGTSYRLAVELQGHQGEIEFGVMPAAYRFMFETTLKMAGADCVVGSALFREWDCLITWRRSKVVWRH